jgi:pyruvate,water dikinase
MSAPSGASPESPPRKGLLRRAAAHLLDFLDIVGLYQRPDPFDARLKTLRLRYLRFRDALSANSEILALIVDLEETVGEGRPAGPASVKAKAVAAMTAAQRMVGALNELSNDRYPSLRLALRRIERRLGACFGGAAPPESRAWVIPLSGLDRSHAPWAGHKMANLGEVRNRVRLPVPDGFVVTARAFRAVRDAVMGPDFLLDPQAVSGDEALEGLARRLQSELLSAEIPRAVEEEILRAHAVLLEAAGPQARVAVRSSTLMEDADLSFAGQFDTLLHVAPGEVLAAYRRVLASLYGSRSVFYRKGFNVEERDVEVAVGVMTMVEASCAGVAYSLDPVTPDSKNVVIHAVRGLGAALVEGLAAPEVIRLGRESGILHREVRPESSETRGAPCLTDDEARTVASWVLAIEDHFGGPQDVEWARDSGGGFFILQTRPVVFAASPGPAAAAPDGARVLLEGGDTAVPGAGAGFAVFVTPETDLSTFPDGGVLVAAHSSPSFVRALRRASAVVTEVGSVAGHMASVAREIGVPALLGAPGALAALADAGVVTVDAGARKVYAGRLEGILTERRASPHRPAGPGSRLLAEVAQYVVPLSLTDPRSPDFTPMACSTLHDVARYCHERLFEEMYGINRLVGDARGQAPLLDVFLPVDLYIIDLGGGLTSPQNARRVRRSEVASPLFASLLDGMLHRGIPRGGPRALSARGFLQVVLHHGVTVPESDASLRDPCYAIVSDRYLNLAARVGYHFSAVDAYCGDFLNENYISFRFKGGAADRLRRERRVRAIAEILKALGFSVRLVNDLVDAHFQKQPRESLLATLNQIGRLLQFMRQLDAAMESEAWVDRVVAAFLREDYGLEGKGQEEERT